MDWFSLMLLALLAAITYIQAIQGLISALIMCVSTLLSAALTFAVYEWVALSLLIEPLGDLSMPVAFIGTFVLTVGLLRVGLDMLIRRANLIPAIIDRAVAAVLGIITAYMMTGMLAIGIQMVPFGGSFLGHAGVDPETHEESSLWLGPDRFAVSFASLMSNGLFSGSRDWNEDHPDLIEEIIWSQAVPRGVRCVAPPDSVRLVRVESPDYVFDKTVTRKSRRAPEEVTYERNNPRPGRIWYSVRLALTSDAADEDSRHRFTTRQVRLVGRGSEGEPTENFRPVAITDDENPLYAVKVDDLKLYAPTGGSEVDFVFDVPESFQPEFIVYKVGARVDMSSVKSTTDEVARSEPEAQAPGTAPEPPEETPTTTSRESADAKAPGAPSSRRGGGRVSGAHGSGSASKFSDRLPRKMTRYQQTGLDQKNGSLVEGHVWGNWDNQGQAGTHPTLEKFDVPGDKRLFQFNVQRLNPKSLFGKAIGFAVTSVKDYHLHDERGNRYPLVGQYVIAEVEGTEVIEIQYFPTAAEFRQGGGTTKFQRVKRHHFDRGNYELVYLFLVEPGTKLTKFTTGQGRRPTDLQRDNLVAPD